MSDAEHGVNDLNTTNNNTGHIVVDNSENNNVDDANPGLNEDEPDAVGEDEGDDRLWLSEGEDEDENYEEDMIPQPRQPVPLSELPETVTVLERNGCLVYVVGTAHFSKQSQDDVVKVIRAARPDVIVVELCQSRVNILQMDEERILAEAKNISLATIQQVIKQNGVMQGVLNILLLNMSAYITKELGMAPGGEFRVAFIEARRLCNGCRFVLGDRPIQVTLQRALASLSIWQRIKLASAILFSKEPITKEDVEKCKQKDMLEQMIEEMTGEFPALGQVFVKERDIYLTNSLHQAARPVSSPNSPEGHVPSVVVAVVGIGHVQGIKTNWNKQLDVEAVCRLPKASMFSVVAKWGFRCSAIGLLTYGCYKASKWTILPFISSLLR